MSSLTILFHPSKSVKLHCELVVVVCTLSNPAGFPKGSDIPLLITIRCWSLMLMIVADYSTSVRIFEALREKTENKTQYDAYVNELKPVREELGMARKSLHFLHFIRKNSDEQGFY